NKDLNYFAAWGTFKTVKDLPDNVLVKAPEKSGVPDGKLVREHARNDCVFVVEHVWRETLTDVVTLEDMRKARDELADLVIGVYAEAFDEAVGKDYDAADLAKWFRTEGKTWAAELTDFGFVYTST